MHHRFFLTALLLVSSADAADQDACRTRHKTSGALGRRSEMSELGLRKKKIVLSKLCEGL